MIRVQKKSQRGHETGIVLSADNGSISYGSQVKVVIRFGWVTWVTDQGVFCFRSASSCEWRCSIHSRTSHLSRSQVSANNARGCSHFLSRDATHKRGLMAQCASVLLSGCLSRSSILWKRRNISSNFFQFLGVQWYSTCARMLNKHTLSLKKKFTLLFSQYIEGYLPCTGWNVMHNFTLPSGVCGR